MLIKVKVMTGARAESVVRKSDDSYAVSVKEKAERNLANRRVLDIFRGLYPKKSIRLIKGHHSPVKILEVK